MTAAGRDPFAHYRAVLRALGFRPSSARGQNFLLDPSLHRWLAATAAPGPADLVLEVGVGLGFLTRELAQRAGRVLGVEIDARLHAVAAAELAALPNVTLLCADVLGGPARGLHPLVTQTLAAALPQAARFLVVANLPYSVSGPLLAELACLPRLPERAVVMVQKELADRVAAGAGGHEYGGLAALVQAAFRARIVRTVPKDVFRPRPKVASAVLCLDRRDDLPLPRAEERRSLAVFLRRLFGQRRKTMRTTLPPAATAVGGRPPEDLPPEFLRQRAEVLGADALVDLWRRVQPAVLGLHNA